MVPEITWRTAGSAPPPDRCPCCSGARYDECCAPLHAGGEAPTAEALMRSRFSAFALGDVSHLRRTWHPTTRPARLELDPDVHWYRLDVLRTERGGLLHDDGVVEFRAHHRSPSARGEMHEVSRFVRDGRAWRYLDGVVGPG